MTDNKTFYYARVSTKEQNLDRQIDEFKKCGLTDERDLITDKASGKDTNRAGYNGLKNQLRNGDTVVIKSIDRLGRNKNDIKNELQWFKDNGVKVKILDFATTMNTDNALMADTIMNIMIELYGYMAEQERTNIKQRQAEGIAAAKIRGKHLGRPTAATPDNWKSVYKQWQAKEITAVAAMTATGLKRDAFYKLVKQEQA